MKSKDVDRRVPLHEWFAIAFSNVASDAFKKGADLFVPALKGYGRLHPQTVSRAIDWIVRKGLLAEGPRIDLFGRKVRTLRYPARANN